MSQDSSNHWVTFLIALGATALGGILVIAYQQVTTPGPGLVGVGYVTVYAPVAPGDAVERIGPTEAYYHIQIRNNGNHKASDIRLSVSPSSAVNVDGTVQRPPAKPSQYLQQVTLPDLGPGDSVEVEGWSNVAIEPKLDLFLLAHGSGYGLLKLRSQTAYRDDTSYWRTVLSTILLGLVSSLAAFALYRESQERKRRRRNVAEARAAATRS